MRVILKRWAREVAFSRSRPFIVLMEPERTMKTVDHQPPDRACPNCIWKRGGK